MKPKIFLTTFISAALLLTACQKDIDVFIPDPGQPASADTVWVSSITTTSPVSILKKELSLIPEIDSFNNNSIAPVSSVSPTGLRCTFSPNSCVNTNGTAVTGTVKTEMLLLKKKGDLIRMDKPTQSNGRMLVSGGVIYLKIKQNTNVLELAPTAVVNIKFSDAAPNPAMKYFLGDASNSIEYNWIQPADSQRNRILTANNQEYNLITGNLQWINCDYFYDTTGINRTVISAQLPNNYTNANTEVFLAFKDFRSVLGMYGSPATKKFSTQKVPVGKAAYIVVISKQGNDYFFAHESIVTGAAGTTEHKVSLTPVKSSLANIKTWLDAL